MHTDNSVYLDYNHTHTPTTFQWQFVLKAYIPLTPDFFKVLYSVCLDDTNRYMDQFNFTGTVRRLLIQTHRINLIAICIF